MIKRRDHPKIIELVKTQTLQQVGDKYGVTRERIRQILVLYDLKIPKRSITFSCPTPGCGKTVTRSNAWSGKYCRACYSYAYHHRKNPFSRKKLRRFEVLPNCKREGCPYPVRAKGLCNGHYTYMKTKADPKAMERARIRNKAYYRKRYYSDPEWRRQLLQKSSLYQKEHKDEINARIREKNRLKHNIDLV